MTTHSPRILRRQEAAQYVGYPKANAGFDAYIHNRLGLQPLPHRPGCYDRVAIDRALDKLSGIKPVGPKTEIDEWFETL